MRLGEFELRLRRSDGLPCPEVEHNGRTYAVASPGTTFVVQVIKHPNPFVQPTPGIFHNVSGHEEARSRRHAALLSVPGSRRGAGGPLGVLENLAAAHLLMRTCEFSASALCMHVLHLLLPSQAAVYVDGQSVGYSKSLHHPGIATFDGFLKSGGERSRGLGGAGWCSPACSSLSAGPHDARLCSNHHGTTFAAFFCLPPHSLQSFSPPTVLPVLPSPLPTDAQACTYQSFVFSAPVESEEKQVTGLNFVEGSIKAAVRPCAAAAPRRVMPCCSLWALCCHPALLFLL